MANNLDSMLGMEFQDQRKLPGGDFMPDHNILTASFLSRNTNQDPGWTCKKWPRNYLNGWLNPNSKYIEDNNIWTFGNVALEHSGTMAVDKLDTKAYNTE